MNRPVPPRISQLVNDIPTAPGPGQHKVVRGGDHDDAGHHDRVNEVVGGPAEPAGVG